MDLFDLLCERLDDIGLTEASKKLHFLLHECAWTSSSELYDELGIEMKRIREYHWDKLTPESKRAFKAAAQSVQNVWPKFDL